MQKYAILLFAHSSQPPLCSYVSAGHQAAPEEHVCLFQDLHVPHVQVLHSFTVHHFCVATAVANFVSLPPKDASDVPVSLKNRQPTTSPSREKERPSIHVVQHPALTLHTFVSVPPFQNLRALSLHYSVHAVTF